MKKQLLLLLFPILSIGQIQIGSNIPGEAANDQCGSSVAMSSDGSIVAIGSSHHDGSGTTAGPRGHTRVYQNVSGVWTQIGADINGEALGDQAGTSVSLSSDGTVLAIGAPYNDGIYGNGSNDTYSGHVRVYKYNAGVWTKIGADLNGESTIDVNGWSVSLSADGNVVAMGSPGNYNSNGARAGHVRIYRNIEGVWTQVGADIDGLAMDDRSGASVSLSGDGNIVAVGAPHNYSQVITSGYVRVFQNLAGVWTQIGATINGEGTYGTSGSSVSLSSDGTILAIGDPSNNGVNGSDSGHVRVYRNVSGTWTQIGADIDGKAANNYSGSSISLSGDGTILAIGSPRNSNGNTQNCGLVRIYQNVGDVWTLIGTDIIGLGSNHLNGTSVSLSSNGTVLAIGAPVMYDGGIPGMTRIYNISAVLSNDDFVLNAFSISPNPSKDFVTISMENNLLLKKVTIYNQLGQLMKTTTNSIVDISELTNGSYYVEIITDKGKGTKKMVKG
jgi:Flp pilus assembly pilin Flp